MLIITEASHDLLGAAACRKVPPKYDPPIRRIATGQGRVGLKVASPTATPPEFETLTVALDGGLGRLTLDQPEKLNPIGTAR